MKNGFFFLSLAVAVFITVFASAIVIHGDKLWDTAQSEDVVAQDDDVIDDVPEEPTPEILKINFQPIVDEWVNSVGGNRSVIVYDLDLDEMVGVYNPDESYNTASLYKLFVVYEGYRRIENGVWATDENAGVTGRSILECLDLAIRESYSPCAETLWSIIGHAQLDQIVKNDFNITNSNISNLLSNASDILKIMKIFYLHSDITNEVLVSRMKDSFLNQPATTYNWRQGLPSGFSVANVYDKVGWDYNSNGYWNIYHDAAIVEFPEQNRHFIIVVMTNRVAFQDIRSFGTMFENEFLKQYND